MSYGNSVNISNSLATDIFLTMSGNCSSFILQLLFMHYLSLLTFVTPHLKGQLVYDSIWPGDQKNKSFQLDRMQFSLIAFVFSISPFTKDRITKMLFICRAFSKGRHFKPPQIQKCFCVFPERLHF